MDGKRDLKNSLILPLFNFSPNFFAFLGGVFISAAVNLYTGVFAGDVLPTKWKVILLSALFAFISGALWSIVAWNLETINRLAITQSPEFVDEQRIRRMLLLARLPKLLANLVCALVCAIMSSIALLF